MDEQLEGWIKVIAMQFDEMRLNKAKAVTEFNQRYESRELDGKKGC